MREALAHLRAALDALDVHYAHPQVGDDEFRLWLLLVDAFTALLKARTSR